MHKHYWINVILWCRYFIQSPNNQNHRINLDLFDDIISTTHIMRHVNISKMFALSWLFYTFYNTKTYLNIIHIICGFVNNCKLFEYYSLLYTLYPTLTRSQMAYFCFCLYISQNLTIINQMLNWHFNASHCLNII